MEGARAGRGARLGEARARRHGLEGGLRELAERERFSVTELERFHDCSSMWLFERVVSPKEIDSALDARIRGGVAHQALYRFYSGLPKRLGIEAVDAERCRALLFEVPDLGRVLDEAAF